MKSSPSIKNNHLSSSSARIITKTNTNHHHHDHDHSSASNNSTTTSFINYNYSSSLSNNKSSHPFVDSPRELFIIFGIKYLESYSYFVLSYTLILFLSKEFGFTDIEAGWAYGFYGMLTSVYGFLMGTIIDTIGVKYSLVFGMLVLLISRTILAFCTDIHVLLIILFTFLPLGGSMGIPVMQIGIKRYTMTSNRLHGYSIFYVMMNLAAITAAPVIDLFRRTFPAGVDFHFFYIMTGVEVHFSPFRMLLLSGAFLTSISFLLALLFLRDVQVDETGSLVSMPSSLSSRTTTTTTTPSSSRPMITSHSSSSEGAPSSYLAIYKSVLGNPKFWRFVLLIVLLMGVRIIFRYLDCLFPKYMVREFGPDVLYGTIIALNPFCVVLVVPFLSTLTYRISSLKMIMIGATISSISPFFLCFGHSYLNAIAFVIMLSLGEACWSPRLYEYTIAIAEDGREGTYMALANMPMFLASLLAGAMSGWLLDTFCPDDGSRHPEVMWFLVGCSSVMSPILLYALKDIIEPPKDSSFRWKKDQPLIKKEKGFAG